MAILRGDHFDVIKRYDGVLLFFRGPNRVSASEDADNIMEAIRRRFSDELSYLEYYK